jgi:hypothetical protein
MATGAMTAGRLNGKTAVVIGGAGIGYGDTNAALVCGARVVIGSSSVTNVSSRCRRYAA